MESAVLVPHHILVRLGLSESVNRLKAPMCSSTLRHALKLIGMLANRNLSNCRGVPFRIRGSVKAPKFTGPLHDRGPKRTALKS